MIPKFDINCYEDFREIVSKTQGERFWKPYVELYRGQTKDSYKLLPQICRKKFDRFELSILEKNIIYNFKKLVEKIKTETHKEIIQLSDAQGIDEYENEWRLLEQMQHLRIPTRLIDWSMDPKVSLFFAVENHDNEVGQFWVFKTKGEWSNNNHYSINPFGNDLSLSISSSFQINKDFIDKIGEKRRGIQSGKFFIQDYNKCQTPMEDQPNLEKRLTKYTINPASKKKIREKLQELKITTDTLYVEYNEQIEAEIKRLKNNI